MRKVCVLAVCGMQRKEFSNLVGKWSLGRRMCGEFELDGDIVTVYKTRFGERAFIGDGKVSDGVLLLKLSAFDALQKEAAFAAVEEAENTKATIVYTADEKSGELFAAGTKELKGEVSIADMDRGKRVIGLKKGAFEACRQVTKITLPAGLKEIGERAFFGCSSLKKIAISSGPRRIPAYAFFGCSALEELTLPDGIEEIGSHAFEFCRSLGKIFLPASVRRIESGAFWGCERLEKVEVADLAAWCAIQFDGEDAAPFIHGAELCLGGKTLRYAEIPQGVLKIGAYAFAGSKLEAVCVPQSLKCIEPTAFEGCTSLTRVVYGGTAAEWFAVEKARRALEMCTVLCTDGKIEKGGTLKRK